MLKYGLLDGGDDDKSKGVGFAETSKIFGTWNAVFFGIESHDRVYVYFQPLSRGAAGNSG